MHQNVIGNNARIMGLLNICDSRGDLARNNLHLHTIDPFFAAIERVYINKKSSFQPDDRIICNQLMTRYYNIKLLIEENNHARTSKALKEMLKVCIEFNAAVINWLDNNGFFGGNKNEIIRSKFYEGHFDIQGKISAGKK